MKGKSTGRRTIGKTDYHARGVLYLLDEARFSTLLNLREGADIGKAINAAMSAIERENKDLEGVLPKTFNIPMDGQGDVFSKIYEYLKFSVLNEVYLAEGL